MLSRINPFSLSLILILVFIGCSKSPSVRPSLLSLADWLASSDHAEGPLIGMMPHQKKSELFGRFERLADSATVPELQVLANHRSPIVRYYSLLALSRSQTPEAFNALLEHLRDTAEARIMHFDMGDEAPLCVFVGTEFLEYYLFHLTPNEGLHGHIRQLAENPLVPAALVALARFRKDSDESFIASQVKQFHWQRPIPPGGRLYYPYYAITSMRECPAAVFFPLLEASVDSIFVGKSLSDMTLCNLIEALVQYNRPESIALFERLLHRGDRNDRAMAQIYLMTALRCYPTTYFDSLAHRISLSRAGSDLVARWSEEDDESNRWHLIFWNSGCCV